MLLPSVESSSGLLQLLKQHLESVCCQHIAPEWLSPSAENKGEQKTASALWKEF